MSAAPPRPDELSAQNPWPGLRAFSESDREFFFGRQKETAELFSLVQRASVVVLYGQSGLGKTSLLQAGLFPQLKPLDYLPLRLRLDHDEQALPLARQIMNALAAALDRAQINAPRPGDNESLWEYFHRRDVDFWGAKNRLLVPVIMLDQFEEVFTLGQKSRAAADRVAAFMAEMEALVEHRPPDSVRKRLEANPDDALRYDLKRESVKFVLSLREDFLPHLDTWRTRIPSLLPNRFRLERMTGAQALDVVQSAGKQLVERDVAISIVDFVSTSQRRRASDRVMEQREVEPALLSVVCDELNRRRVERGQERITADLLTGERESIIQSFYDRAFEGADPRVRDWVEDELLTASGYRDRAAQEDAFKQGLPEGTIDQLVDRRILHREEREGVVWLELTHDLLTDPAAASRTAREQRRQAAQAAAREAAAAQQLAQSRRKLRRARRANVVFAGFLLLAIFSLAGLVWGWLMARRTAEEQAVSLHEALHNELISPQPGGDKLIAVADGTLRRSFHQFGWSSSRLKDLYSESLSMDAEILYEHGQIRRGLGYADRAMQSIDHLRGPWVYVDEEVVHLRTAQALYTLGKGSFEAGKLKGARQHFNAAIKEAQLVHKPENKSGAARVLVLASIGLGDAEAAAYEISAATNHYENVGALFNQTNGISKLESSQLLAMDLMGYGQIEVLDRDALGDFEAADLQLSSQDGAEGRNLRSKRLMAEIRYRQGRTQMKLDHLDQSKHYLDESQRLSKELTGYDEDDLGWKLGLAMSDLGIRVLHSRQQEWLQNYWTLDDTTNVLENMTSGSNANNGWYRPHFLELAVVFDQADAYLAQKEYGIANLEFVDVRTNVEALLRDFPEMLELKRTKALVISRLGDVEQYEGNSATNSADQRTHWKQAAESYDQSLGILEDFKRDHKETATIQIDRVYSLWSRALVLGNLTNYSEALALFEQAEGIQTGLAGRYPANSSFHRDLVSLHQAHAQTLKQMQDIPGAIAEFGKAAEVAERALASQPGDVQLLKAKAEIKQAEATIRLQDRKWEEGMRALEAARAATMQAWFLDPLNASVKDQLNVLHKLSTNFWAEVVTKADDPAVAAGLPLGKRIDKFYADTDLAVLTRPVPGSNVNNLVIPAEPLDWPLAPLLPGVWRTLLPAEFTNECLHLPAEFTNSHPVRMRMLPLDFYENTALYEAEIRQTNGESGILEYLRHGGESSLLDGTSNPIHLLNDDLPPRLDTASRAAQYALFFCAAISQTEGPFVVVQRADDLYWRPEVLTAERDQISRLIKPFNVNSTSDGWWSFSGTLQYSNALYYVMMRVARNGAFAKDKTGSVEMSDDDRIATDLPIRTTNYRDGLRVMANTKPTEEALFVRPTRLQALKLWPQAVLAYREYIDYLKNSKTTNTNEKLSAAYLACSWTQLFAHDFNGALETTEAGKKLDESSLYIDTNRAHALLFLGRTAEADRLYLGNRGKTMRPDEEGKWDTAILKDFDDLEKGGLSSPEFARLREQLKPSK